MHWQFKWSLLKIEVEVYEVRRLRSLALSSCSDPSNQHTAHQWNSNLKRWLYCVADDWRAYWKNACRYYCWVKNLVASRLLSCSLFNAIYFRMWLEESSRAPCREHDFAFSDLNWINLPQHFGLNWSRYFKDVHLHRFGSNFAITICHD